VYSLTLTSAVAFAARGGYHPRPSGGSGASSGLISSFVHAIVWSLGWHAGSDLASLLGPKVLIVGAIVAVVWYLRRNRRGSRR